MISKDKHSNKLSIEDKHDIIQCYLLDRSNENMQLICSKYNITRQYVYKLLKTISEQTKNDIVNESIKEYQKQFTKKASVIIDMLLDRIKKELSNSDKIQLSQLTTSLGILYDKSRLENNQSTSNQSININIKIDWFLLPITSIMLPWGID